jgi:hypothetical protein
MHAKEDATDDTAHPASSNCDEVFQTCYTEFVKFSRASLHAPRYANFFFFYQSIKRQGEIFPETMKCIADVTVAGDSLKAAAADRCLN